MREDREYLQTMFANRFKASKKEQEFTEDLRCALKQFAIGIGAIIVMVTVIFIAALI